jgi:hypothetical protein
MNSEPAKTTETVGFRFPALVALAPKRRFKIRAPIVEEKEAPSQESSPPQMGIHNRPRLKRSGRVIFRWPGPSIEPIRATL